MRYWLKKIREYRDMAWDAARDDDKEFAYVYAFKAAVLIFDKMPKLEDFRTLLDVHQKENLADHGRQLIELINSLTPQLQREYDQWMEAERLKVEAVEARRAQAAAEAALAALQEATQAPQRATSESISTVTAEDSQVAVPAESTPQSPPPDYFNGALGMELQAETDKQRQMRLLAADISRPNTPVSHDTPLPSELLSGPPTSSPITGASHPDGLKSDRNGDDSELDLSEEDYGESHWACGRLPSYEDVLVEILQEGPGLSATSGGGGSGGLSASCGAVGANSGAGRDGAPTPERREDNDNGSDYNIQVVEPGGLTPLSPQFKDLPPLPVDEKKELQRREREEGMSNGAPEPVVAPRPTSPSPGLSRRSSIAKDKKKGMQARNPDAEPSSSSCAQPANNEGFNLHVLEMALDTVYAQLEFLGSSGNGTVQLPRDVKRKIANLNLFLIQ